jgi:hypothetical protein
MSSPLYSIRMALEKNSTTWTSADVPAGYIWVVRDISMIWGGLVGASGVIAIGDTGFFAYDFNPTTTNVAHWDGRAVLEAGEHLDQASTGDGVDFVISGYQLSLP